MISGNVSVQPTFYQGMANITTCFRILVSFDEIESIAGIPIDHSFLRYKKELLEYGFRVEKISMKEKTVAFIHDRMEKEVSP